MPQEEQKSVAQEQPESAILSSPLMDRKIQPLLGDRVNIAQLAIELDPEDPPCQRSVYNLLQQLGVPYVKVLNTRWYDRNEVRAAILTREVNRRAPRRGRPSKNQFCPALTAV